MATARQWRSIECAPYDTPVDIRVSGSKRAFEAKLLRDHSINERGAPCDQWVATTDRYPRCWSEGACWESNADEQMSAQPTSWREKPCDN